jgi:hypothetical protein
MESMALLSIAWTVLLVHLLLVRFGVPVAMTARRIDFNPKEPVVPDQLSSYLLSANLALMEGDNFNQLASALSLKRVAQALDDHWGISNRSAFARTLSTQFTRLGQTPADTREAFAAWLAGVPLRTSRFAALFEVCHFLSAEAGIIDARRTDQRHLKTIAWDVQQLAYMIRLGHSAGYLPREVALSHLHRLRRLVTMYYSSWEDYSASALIGIGLSQHYDRLDTRKWYQLGRTHKVLLSSGHRLLEEASMWKRGAPSPFTSASFPPDGPEEQHFMQLSAAVADEGSDWSLRASAG